MKKLCVLIMSSVLFLFFSADVKAEGMHLFFNVGAITDDSLSFDSFIWYVGMNLDFHIGGFLMLSPEANVAYSSPPPMAFSPHPRAALQTAVLLNAKLGKFFIGGGIQKYFIDDSNFPLKLNAGFVGKHIRSRIFLDMTFDSLFKEMLVGFQIGITF